MANRIDQSAEDQALKLWESTSHNARLIGDLLGLSNSTVRRILSRNGIVIDHTETRQRKRRTSPETDAEIVARYAAGESAQSLADAYGFKAMASVTQRVRESGQAVKPRGQREQFLTEEQGLEVLRLRNDEGWSQERIAASMPGIGQERISKWLRENGHRTWELSRHPRFKGGPVRLTGGYMGVKVEQDDPLSVMALTHGYVLEHRYVMAKALGRPLSRTETVHHINGDKTDNRLGNLQLRQGAHGKGTRFTCMDCGSHNVAAAPLS